MRAAKIVNGKVENIIVVASADVSAFPGYVSVADGTLCGIGWTESGGTYTQPVIPPKPLNEVRDAKLTELQAARNAAEAANVTVQGKTFSAEPSTAKRFESLAARLRRGKPTTLNAIFEVDGTPVFPVTQALLDQIEDAIAAQGEAAWNKYGTLAGQVMAATNNTQVEAIAW